MIYGYARISRKEQNIDRQIRNIRKVSFDAVIVQEAYTGTTSDRPKWNALKSALQKGDTVIFDSVSRMSRNAEEGFSEYRALYMQGVEMIFLKEPQINTSTYKQALSGQIEMTGTDVDIILEAVNKYLMRLAEQQIRLAFEQAQKEVDDLHQRTKEGMLSAKLAGKKIGRRKGRGMTEKERKAKHKMLARSSTFGGYLNDTDCMHVLGISRSTFYRYKRELLTNKEQEMQQ